MKKIQICALVLFLVVIAISAKAEGPLEHPLDDKKQRLAKRDRFIGLQNLLDNEVIKIKPGMTILDIGAGRGYGTYILAEKLAGTGKVFATDIREDIIDYLAFQADKRSLDNLQPVLVQEEGLDPFYRQQTYDLIFLNHIYYRIEDRRDYFRKLRDYLAEDGQLVVIMYKSVFLFHVHDFNDFKGVLQGLAPSETKGNPFYDNLRKSTQELLKKTQEEADEILKSALVEDFNRMLRNPRFFESFMQAKRYLHKTTVLSPSELDFVDWFLMILREDGILDKNQEELTPKEMRRVMKLNTLFFVQQFRPYLYEGSPHPLVYDDRSSKSLDRQVSRFLVRDELEDAGYVLEKEYDELPYNTILFFRAKKNASKGDTG
ncbi:class I SAM-dependent methyltransferase [Thermodesulfobacteriota bacterium]